MPAPVRRPRRVLCCFALLALGLAPAAAGGNGGLAPQAPASPSEGHIRDIYWLILGVTGAIFLLVITCLVVFLVRYRSRGRPREIEGAQVRGHTKLELAWTAGPVVILAVIAAFVFWKVSDFSATASTGPKEEITIDAHQYYWEFVYPNGAISVDDLRLPVDRPMRLTVVAHDVAHSWWVPALGGKLDAIPGKTNHLSLRATKQGVFNGQCAEFCGLLHAAMMARVEVLAGEDYDMWVQERRTNAADLGKETFDGVCAKCHGLSGQGDIGPNIASNPLLGDRSAISNIIRNGTGKMPAVGKDWSQEQLDATIAYLQKRFHQGGSSGG
jgi:cytochrome c oxidase subunit 2